MQKAGKKPKREKLKTQKNNNPFGDIFFWLTITHMDFLFEVIESGEEAMPKPEKQAVED